MHSGRHELDEVIYTDAGGGLLLVVNLLWVMKPEWFGIPSTAFAVKASFVSVAVWWGVFAVPLLRHVPEPAATGTATGGTHTRYNNCIFLGVTNAVLATGLALLALLEHRRGLAAPPVLQLGLLLVLLVGLVALVIPAGADQRRVSR